MDAHKAIITDIFNNSTLVEVPFFQRSYVWKDDLWGRFLEDMEFVVKTDKPHFLGSIILKQGRKPLPGEFFSSCRTLVDGQQRLTTFLIFLKVLCMKLGQTAFFDFQFRIMGKNIALRHGRNDVEAFEKTMAATEPDEIDNPKPGSRVIEAYNYFVKNINASKLNIMPIIMNAQFVRIDLDENEDEQQIFDTLNSLGVNLTTSELLKNYFFSRETISDYESKWVSVFEKDEETKAYWETEIETGRIKRALIDIFFDAYFQIFIQDKKYQISNEDKLMYSRVDNLALSYQNFINSYCGGNKNVVLDQLKEYAVCFMKTFRPEICDMSISRSYGIERINIIIFGLKTSTLIPYVLYIAKNVCELEKRNEMYRILESYIMRRMIAHTSTKNYNNVFTSLILNAALDSNSLMEKLGNSNDVTTYIPNDIEVNKGFHDYRFVNLQSRGIIYLIESVIRPDHSSTALLGFNGYSLEHMMPKKWRNNWPKCQTEEGSQRRDSVLLTLGNLAIIPQELNASIRDGGWQTKKEGKDGKPGLEICAAGMMTVFDALQKDEWTENDIWERAEWLYSHAKKIWELK